MESDQVTENFGVRFGCKVYPFVGKEPFQGAKIFDNTVMNQNELLIVAQMRMSVGDGYRTVSGPSGMSDTKGMRVSTFSGRTPRGYSPDPFHEPLKISSLHGRQCQPSHTPVLQSTKTIDQRSLRGFTT